MTDKPDTLFLLAASYASVDQAVGVATGRPAAAGANLACAPVALMTSSPFQASHPRGAADKAREETDGFLTRFG